MSDRDSSFRTTRWSVVQAAGGPDTSAAREALVVLCESYWYPLYTFLRRAGHQAADAEDLTQGFFGRLLEKRDIGGADPLRGRFRAYLLTSLKHFTANVRNRERAIKRGGPEPALSIDFLEADRRYQLEADDRSDPEHAFERQWALALLGRAMQGLHEDYTARDQAELFAALHPTLVGGDDSRSREELAAALDMNEGALNTAIHRLRKRFRDRLRAEVAETVSDPGEVDDELGILRSVLGR